MKMSPEELKLRNRFRAEYAPALEAFWDRVGKLGYTDEELWAVPGLFLPGCGSLYSQSLVKVALIGEGTNYWNDSLLQDLADWRAGKYNAEFSFSVLQEESLQNEGVLCNGPTKWRNKFWRYLAEVLNSIYSTSNALEPSSPIFKGIAWGNRHAIEVYKPNGVGGGIAIDKITPSKVSALDKLADECGLTDMERFIRVFEPDVIIYTCHNRAGGSDYVLPKDAKLIEHPLYPKVGCPWVVKVYMTGDVLIIQTQHSSWVSKKHVTQGEYGQVIASILRRHNLCMPPAKQRFYISDTDPACTAIGNLLNREAERIFRANEWADKRIVSYQLAYSLAVYLEKANSTMAASLFVKLLNRVERFKSSGWQYSPQRRGPCAVVAGAWRYFHDNAQRKDERAAAKIADAFRRNDGDVAW